MPSCSYGNCRQPATAIIHAEGPDNCLHAATCPRHADQVRAQATATGGPIREQAADTPPDPQLDLLEQP